MEAYHTVEHSIESKRANFEGNLLKEIEKHQEKVQEIEKAKTLYDSQTQKLINKMKLIAPKMKEEFSKLIDMAEKLNIEYCTIPIRLNEDEKKEYDLQKDEEVITFSFSKGNTTGMYYSSYNDYFILEKNGKVELMVNPEQAIKSSIVMFIYINWNDLIKAIENEVISLAKERDETSWKEAKKATELATFYLEKLS